MPFTFTTRAEQFFARGGGGLEASLSKYNFVCASSPITGGSGYTALSEAVDGNHAMPIRKNATLFI
jgi:hypothetical protein